MSNHNCTVERRIDDLMAEGGCSRFLLEDCIHIPVWLTGHSLVIGMQRPSGQYIGYRRIAKHIRMRKNAEQYGLLARMCSDEDATVSAYQPARWDVI